MCPVGVEAFYAHGRIGRGTDSLTDGQTDMTKLIVAFRNSGKSPGSEIKVQYQKG